MSTCWARMRQTESLRFQAIVDGLSRRVRLHKPWLRRSRRCRRRSEHQQRSEVAQPESSKLDQVPGRRQSFSSRLAMRKDPSRYPVADRNFDVLRMVDAPAPQDATTAMSFDSCFGKYSARLAAGTRRRKWLKQSFNSCRDRCGSVTTRVEVRLRTGALLAVVEPMTPSCAGVSLGSTGPTLSRPPRSSAASWASSLSSIFRN